MNGQLADAVTIDAIGSGSGTVILVSRVRVGRAACRVVQTELDARLSLSWLRLRAVQEVQLRLVWQTDCVRDPILICEGLERQELVEWS